MTGLCGRLYRIIEKESFFQDSFLPSKSVVMVNKFAVPPSPPTNITEFFIVNEIHDICGTTQSKSYQIVSVASFVSGE